MANAIFPNPVHYVIKAVVNDILDLCYATDGTADVNSYKRVSGVTSADNCHTLCYNDDGCKSWLYFTYLHSNAGLRGDCQLGTIRLQHTDVAHSPENMVGVKECFGKSEL